MKKCLMYKLKDPYNVFQMLIICKDNIKSVTEIKLNWNIAQLYCDVTQKMNHAV